MKDILETWERRPYVEALVAFRGFQTVAAMTAVSELGDLGRFAHPRQLMGYLGLVPGEDSSGARRRQGSITKTGNGHARWMLIECASHYSHPPRVSPQLSARQEGQSREVRAIAWRAQNYPAARDLRNGFAPGLPQGGMAVPRLIAKNNGGNRQPKARCFALAQMRLSVAPQVPSWEGI